MRESPAGKKLQLQLDKLCLQYDETKGKVCVSSLFYPITAVAEGAAILGVAA